MITDNTMQVRLSICFNEQATKIHMEKFARLMNAPSVLYGGGITFYFFKRMLFMYDLFYFFGIAETETRTDIYV